MSKISFTPNAAGTGTFTIASPDSNTNRTLTLPDETGTMLTSVSAIPAANLTGALPAIDGSALTGIDTAPPTTLGAVGTYALMRDIVNTNSAGVTRAGSGLEYSSASGIASGLFGTGTWRCMGVSTVAAYGGSATIWLRIS